MTARVEPGYITITRRITHKEDDNTFTFKYGEIEDPDVHLFVALYGAKIILSDGETSYYREPQDIKLIRRYRLVTNEQILKDSCDVTNSVLEYMMEKDLI